MAQVIKNHIYLSGAKSNDPLHITYIPDVFKFTGISAKGRRVTRNFSGQGRFLKIRALRQIFNQQHTKEKPRRENFRRFFSYIRLKSILNEKWNTKMNLVRAFFPKISALFFKFWKRAGETFPPPIPPSSYAPEKEPNNHSNGMNEHKNVEGDQT